MRLKHGLTRPLTRTATMAVLATAVALIWGTGVSLAADFQDAKSNVCEGNLTSPWCEWGSHVTGSGNVALGPNMMPALTTGFENLALGSEALFANTSGVDNVALGNATLQANTTGFDNIAMANVALRRNKTGHANIAIGNRALEENTTGNNNVASGKEALASNTTGENNVASGFQALLSNTTGYNNVASGPLALKSNTTGHENIAFGIRAGGKLTSGSANIDIYNEGVVATEDNTIRIGTEGTQKRAFVAGIWPTPIGGPLCIVKVNSEGQLGCNPGEIAEKGETGEKGEKGETGATGEKGEKGETGATGPAGGSAAIATFATKAKTVASGNCLNYTVLSAPGTGPCPGSTTGYSNSVRLAGPTPASGATVTNLYADTSANVVGTDTVLVAVIDNTTGATLLTCTVNSTNKDSCSNPSGSGVAAAGDNIEVKITANGPSGNQMLWRVTFRY
jgi:hypothetical protein